MACRYGAVMTKRFYIDVETSSKAALKEVGTPAYFAHESTRLNCLCFAVDDGPVMLIPYDECHPESEGVKTLRSLLAFDDYVVIAHKANFEREALKVCLGIHIPLDKFRCTLARGAYYGYPHNLNDLTVALNCPVLKDVQGAAVMRQLCTGKYTPQQKPAEFQRLYQYCGGDIESMRHADKRLPELPPIVFASWLLNEDINDIGVPIDLPAVQNAVSIKEYLKQHADDMMSALTGGVVTTVGQIDKIGDWLRTQGVNLIDLTADTVTRALAGPLPAPARECLTLRQGAGLSSLSKYDAMLRAQTGGRLRHMEYWYGAHTGRANGELVQLKNLARTLDAETWANLLAKHPDFLVAVFGPAAAKKMKEALRGMLRSSGDDGDPDENWFLGLDLSQIEARGTGWLADALNFLAMFAEGRDPYCEYGYQIFGHQITKADLVKRTAAKAAVLSMGFAGGIGAFQTGAENYNLDLNILASIILPGATPAEVHEANKGWKYYIGKRPFKPLTYEQGLAADIVKQRFRRDFPRIVQYWDELENAFLTGGWAGRIHIDIRPYGLHVLTLPSGRQLFYHDVQSNGRDYSYQGTRGRSKLWKGTLIENCAQSINDDCMTHFKLLARKHVGPIVHTCHDEFTLEIPRRNLETSKATLREVMKVKPDWADGLPLAYDMWDGKRYG